MREVTQGMLDRFQRRCDMLNAKPRLFGLGRRAQLKAMRDAMSRGMTTTMMRRQSLRIAVGPAREKIRESWRKPYSWSGKRSDRWMSAPYGQSTERVHRQKGDLYREAAERVKSYEGVQS